MPPKKLEKLSSLKKSKIGNEISQKIYEGSSMAYNALTSLLPVKPTLPPLNSEQLRLSKAKKNYQRLADLNRRERLSKQEKKMNEEAKRVAKNLMYKKLKKELVSILSSTKAQSSLPKSAEKIIKKILDIEHKHPELKRRNNKNGLIISNILNEHSQTYMNRLSSAAGQAQHSMSHLLNEPVLRSVHEYNKKRESLQRERIRQAYSNLGRSSRKERTNLVTLPKSKSNVSNNSVYNLSNFFMSKSNSKSNSNNSLLKSSKLSNLSNSSTPRLSNVKSNASSNELVLNELVLNGVGLSKPNSKKEESLLENISLMENLNRINQTEKSKLHKKLNKARRLNKYFNPNNENHENNA